jgi:hypothetical protein
MMEVGAMTATGEGKGRRALSALSDLARRSARPPTPEQLDQGLRAVRSHLDDTQRKEWRAFPRHKAALWYAALGIVAVSAIVASNVVPFRSPRAPVVQPALSYRLEGGNLIDGGYLRESGPSGIRAVFSEGTQFILMPGTRSRLREVDATGARITIEHGSASFQVTPAKDHRWQVDVGPFLVTVKGTVFTVSWDAVTEKFELKLQRGAVTVSGPSTSGEIALRAGQRLLVDLPKGEAVINEHIPEERSEPAHGSAPGESEPPVDRPREASRKLVAAVGKNGSASSATKPGDDHQWAAALAGGHLDHILDEAERAGVKATLQSASSDDLLALADAARYRRRTGLARDALLATRRRFRNSPPALDAAFLLGRVEEMSDHGEARAIQWYDDYLRQAPAGTYASEALGRKMTLTNELGGTSRARPIAEEYLRRFPAGTYAGPARAIVGAR